MLVAALAAGALAFATALAHAATPTPAPFATLAPLPTIPPLPTLPPFSFSNVPSPTPRAITTGPVSGPASPATLTAAPGDLVQVSGDGFFPLTKVDVTLESSPITLGTSNADAHGLVSLVLRIPVNVSAGKHRLLLSGRASDLKSTRVLESTLTVSGKSAARATTTAAAKGKTLPKTGSDVGRQVLYAMLVLTLGEVLMGAEAYSGRYRPQNARR
jgi:hypothetical protein